MAVVVSNTSSQPVPVTFQEAAEPLDSDAPFGAANFTVTAGAYGFSTYSLQGLSHFRYFNPGTMFKSRANFTLLNSDCVQFWAMYMVATGVEGILQQSDFTNWTTGVPDYSCKWYHVFARTSGIDNIIGFKLASGLLRGSSTNVSPMSDGFTYTSRAPSGGFTLATQWRIIVVTITYTANGSFLGAYTAEVQPVGTVA